jgi:hypothetical protein
VGGLTKFVGPGNVTDWLGEPLTYYAAGTPFDACATDVVPLLLSPTGSGQCGSFAYLLLATLATNGIRVSTPFTGWTYPNPQVVWTRVSVADNTGMIVNSWRFNGNGGIQPPYLLGAYAFPYQTYVGITDAMVPGPPSPPGYGDLTNMAGAPGQNSPTPSEKIFGSHFIVDVLDSTLTSSFDAIVPTVATRGPFFDPSYGLAYFGPSDFESQAVAGYLTVLDVAAPGIDSAAARQRGGNPNILLTPCCQ